MEFENDFFALSRPALQSGGDDRRAHDLPITKQAAALTISRASVYYLPQPVSAAYLALMRWIDELHLESGSRLMRHLLPRGARPSACHDSDRGALWPPQPDQARVWSQGLSVSAALCSDHATEPGLSDGSGNRVCWRLTRRENLQP